MTLSNEWYNTELENSELETLHRSPTVEYSFYNAVRSGDMEAVIKNCSEDEFIRLEGTGVLSRNALTNIKYHFVVTTAMLTRYCIDGGLEPEQAYRLSDFYNQDGKALEITAERCTILSKREIQMLSVKETHKIEIELV